MNGAIQTSSPQREALTDDDFYLLINAHHESISCTLPKGRWSRQWLVLFNTDTGWEESEGKRYAAGEKIKIEARSWCVLIAAAE
jgi:glycogen operon protein